MGAPSRQGPAGDALPALRARLCVGLLSAGVLVLELALLRSMALRFWGHFAQMVISVALLGFGASGTALTLLRARVVRRRRAWTCGLAMAFALAAAAAPPAARLVTLDAEMLAWDARQWGGALLLELVLLVPFLLAAGAIGAVLTDRPRRLGGHYAANLLGSGLGALAAVALMYVLDTPRLLVVPAIAGLAAGLVLLPWRRPAATAAALAAAGAVALLVAAAPREGRLSQYKLLSILRSMPAARTIHRAEGPLGRIDVLAGPAMHFAPGLSLQYTGPVPPHVVMVFDGDAAGGVYHAREPNDWAFLDYTLPAAAYHVRPPRRALVIGAGGGAEIGLALYQRHRGPQRDSSIVALEMNRQVIDAMRGPLAAIGGDIYDAPGVTVLPAEARGFLAEPGEPFDLIDLPPLDAFAAGAAGLQASQENYLYTVEAFEAILDRLSHRGVLVVTRWARTPPRDALRVFDTAAQALRRRGLPPAEHLALIRSWATTAVLVFRSPIAPADAAALREFCFRRSFDVAWLPDLRPEETNRFHTLDRPYYYQAARAMLGPRREAFLREYPFDVAAASDDRPYFQHFFRWRSFGAIREQLGRRSRAFVELGYLLLLAALAQAGALAAVLIVLPLAPGLRSLRGQPRKPAAMGYFFLLGAAFMLLEMVFLQKLVLYLAHPVYSAAVVIAGFLLFAGLGSMASARWRARPARVAAAAGAAVVAIALAYVGLLGGILSATQSLPLPLRAGVALLLIAPLAAAMGHMFPAGLRQLAAAAPPLVPWAWAANGFASVLAAVAAALLAMSYGFRAVLLLAVACYAAAVLLDLRLPAAPPRFPAAAESAAKVLDLPGR